jgi:hypothetical protein
MALSGLSTLTVARRGWADKREVRGANVQASWTVSRPGRLSATLSARDAWLMGIDDYLGRWVRWDHPLMGPWGGEIEDQPVNLGGGLIELSCTGFAAILKRYRTKKHYRAVSSPAGSLVLRAFADLAIKTPFDTIGADTDGDPIAHTWRGDLLSSVVDRLAKASAHQYDATLADDWTIDFEFRRRTGSDKTGSVCLIEGYHIADGAITPSVSQLTNDILAVSGIRNWDKAPSTVAQAPNSIVTYGRRQAVQRYSGFTTARALESRAKVDLAALDDPVIPVTIRLSDREPQLSEIRQGDTIRVVSSSANAEYIVDITGRAVDADSGVVSLVGDAELAA